MKRISALLFALAVSSGAWAAAPQPVFDLKGEEAKTALSSYSARIQAKQDDFDALKNAGILLHQMNRFGSPNKEYVMKGEEYLKKAKQLSEDDQEVVAWLGSIVTMKAMFENDPGKQMFFVKQGSNYLDTAVKKAPDNMVVRLTRAYNSLELPAFLKRTRFAVEDFNYYINWCTQHTCPAGQLAEAKDKLKAAQKIVTENK